MASIGGFCAGEREVVDHQRLSGLGYCFSASLPPYLATAAIGALDRLEQDPTLAQRVAENAAHMRELLSQIPGLQVLAASHRLISPLTVKHCRVVSDCKCIHVAAGVCVPTISTAQLRKVPC